MSLSDLSDPAAVERAIEEFDRLGRDEFLTKYGFGRSRRYELLRDGQRYDVKAIVGAAHGFQHPDKGPLRQQDFTSGLHTVVPKLRSLGFEVVDRDGDGAGARRSFLFQANPEYYDIEAAIRSLPEMNWTVKQMTKQVHAGDRVYIWKSGKDRGVIAEGTILTDPAMLPDQEGQQFIRDRAKFDGEQLRVRLSIDRVLDPPIRASTLMRSPTLRGLGVLKFANATNYGLEPEEDRALQILIGPAEAGAASLRDRVEQWLRETGYPNPVDHKREAERRELSEAFTQRNLLAVEEDPGKWEILRFGRFTQKAYGDPGNQATISKHLKDDPDAKRDVAKVLRFLLHGRGSQVERLDRVLTDEELRVPGLSESLTTKALAVAYPERWLPLYQYSGPMGKLGIMASPELQIETPADLEQRTLAERIAFTNDVLRERLEPLIPGDPWAQMVFLYWLRDQHRTPPPVEAGGEPSGRNYVEPALEEILAEVRSAGMSIGERTLLRYHLGLRARGFVILSGLSGAGKTWLAELYAAAARAEHLLVPVAPNWTTNEDLLGYLNPITDTFQHSEFSEFVREAAEEWAEADDEGRAAVPFHVTLDEMNLARVEYYFARLLSAMEVRERHGVARLELAPGELAQLTPNLRFTGTVNVDETTHGFADKVFDRAQLLELAVSREAIAKRLADAGYGELLLRVWDAVHPVAPFAFRVLDELAAYVESSEAIRPGWEEPLDEQLLQKVLPKVRGADLRIGPSLEALLEITEEALPLTHVKAKAMHESFQQHGFASYF